ncbi:aminopeptidase [Portibacter marinus]|uniref:aminopeptidase n=1 Tax=Portibacter marinus TaxID=2898660 RepID=UPI001F261629|nr:aminopeptidase [Portibacter marinus]
MLNKYARLLTGYSLDLKAGEKLYIKSTTLAEPLIREVYREAIKIGAHVTVDMSFQGQSKIFMDHANDDQLEYISPTSVKAMEDCDAYLYIRAPFNLKADKNIDPLKRRKRAKANNNLQKIYFDRLADGSLKRSLCQYPTQANAQEAEMSLEEYETFVFNACKLDQDDPVAAWLEVRKSQQKIVDFLNQKSEIRYKRPDSDIVFSVKGRTWINSDGMNNMPSGEVFSAPVEDSVNGEMTFDYPAIYMGQEARGIRLKVKDGQIVEWSAEHGQDLLDQVFAIPGANYFGEVAIGMNYGIQQATKNILFDEKIGGSIHMAVGQSYGQCGGKNESAVHWDMISDMKNGGQIFADDELIYENGQFLI